MNEKLPTIRCTGYPLSYVEASNWYRVLYGGRKKWPLFGLAAMGVIAFEAWLGLMFNSRTLGTEGMIGLFFLFACSMTAEKSVTSSLSVARCGTPAKPATPVV